MLNSPPINGVIHLLNSHCEHSRLKLGTSSVRLGIKPQPHPPVRQGYLPSPSPQIPHSLSLVEAGGATLHSRAGGAHQRTLGQQIIPDRWGNILFKRFRYNLDTVWRWVLQKKPKLGGVLNLIIYVGFSPFQLISEPFFRMLCVSDSELIS